MKNNTSVVFPNEKCNLKRMSFEDLVYEDYSENNSSPWRDGNYYVPIYNKITGESVENPADYILYHNKHNQEGFGGAIFNITTLDSGDKALNGCWLSNSRSLYETTKVDIRETQLISIIASEHLPDIGEGIPPNRLYKDPVVEVYNELTSIDLVIRKLNNTAWKLGKELYYTYRTLDGGCSGRTECFTS